MSTQLHTTYISKSEAHQILSEKLVYFEENYKKISNEILTSELYPLQKDTYHFLIKFLKPNNRVETVFCKHLLNLIFQAELISQGSAKLAFLLYIAAGRYIIRNANVTLSDIYKNNIIDLYDIELQEAFKSLEKLSTPITRPALEEALKTTPRGSQEHVLGEVLNQALDLAGLNGRIFIENGKQKNYLIESKEGYSFFLKPFIYFLDNEKIWERNDVKILLIDGFLENVSEIDHILQKVYETKQPLVIVAHGFSEEVVATLKANQERKNFDILPLRIAQDLENINTIIDLSVVCGTEPVSSLKGEMIVFTKYEALPTISKIRCTPKETNIEISETKNAVYEHMRVLLEKRANSNTVEDIQNLIDKRLRSLVSNSTIIHLPDISETELKTIRVNIDNSLRMAKSLLNYGTINLNLVIDEIKSKKVLEDNNIVHNIMVNGLQEILNASSPQNNNQNIPTLSLAISLKLAIPAAILFFLSDGIVYFNEL